MIKKASLKFKNKICLLLCLICFGCFVMVSQKPPKQYIAYMAKDSIIIDGLANEKSWKNAEWTTNFIDIEGDEIPKYKTQLKMIWDAKYLYFFAKLEEPHVWATLKQRDTVIFYNNDFEIFIDPDGDTHNYYEYEMNAQNTLWDLFLTKPYRNKGKVLDSWDIQGVQSAVSIQGTLNDASDVDSGWAVEIAIPWRVITEASSSTLAPVNDFWRINFSRVNWDFDLTDGRYSRKKDEKTGKFASEYNWVWSPQGVINMHEPEKWGYVYFAPEKVGDKSSFELPKEEHIKWYLYDLYKELRSEPYSDVLHKDYKKIVKAEKYVLGELMEPELDIHASGWNLKVKSPFLNKTLLIKQDGKFISYEAKK